MAGVEVGPWELVKDGGLEGYQAICRLCGKSTYPGVWHSIQFWGILAQERMSKNKGSPDVITLAEFTGFNRNQNL
jgi:hypothetical protein